MRLIPTIASGLAVLLPVLAAAQQPSSPPAQQPQRLDPATQANVQMNRSQPQVSVQDAQPQVSIERVAEEPKITVERMTRKEASLRDVGVADRQQMVGLDVVGQDGGDVGEVHDLLLTSGRIDSVVVEASSGFLGMNEKLVSVPWQQVQVDGEEKRLRLPMTDDAIKNLPEFQYEQIGQRQALVGPEGQRN